jgi:hypothetical protein
MDSTATSTPSAPSDPIVIPSLLEYVYGKLRDAAEHKQMAQLARDVPADYSWLCKFANDKIPGASYTKIHELAEYFFRRDCQAEIDAGRPAPVWPFLPAPAPSDLPESPTAQ